MKIPELIKLTRRKYGLSQAQLGEILGYTYQSISSFETGRKKHPHPVVLEYALNWLDIVLTDKLIKDKK